MSKKSSGKGSYRRLESSSTLPTQSSLDTHSTPSPDADFRATSPVDVQVVISAHTTPTRTTPTRTTPTRTTPTQTTPTRTTPIRTTPIRATTCQLYRQVPNLQPLVHCDYYKKEDHPFSYPKSWHGKSK